MPNTVGGASADTMPDVQQPTIGERVHYRSHGSAPLSDGTQVYLPKCRTAIVVDVIAADACTLFVITPNGIFHDDCRRDEDGHDGGTWHMPCDQALAHD